MEKSTENAFTSELWPGFQRPSGEEGKYYIVTHGPTPGSKCAVGCGMPWVKDGLYEVQLYDGSDDYILTGFESEEKASDFALAWLSSISLLDMKR